jgi:hypothetical protein
VFVRFRNGPEESGVVGAVGKPLKLVVTAIDDAVTMIRNDGD